jgi:HAD superfamily hydrolase (TIGR01484 family)
MRPISSLSIDEASRLRALLFDLDDTMLDGTRLGERAFSALYRLREAGLALVGVTGRPSGWAEVLARLFPVDGIVSENGAIACYADGKRLRVFDPAETARAERRTRLEVIAGRVFARFDGLEPSDDSSARRSDVAIDIGEHHRVPPERVAAARAYAEELGARTFTSSVHLHLTLDGANKASGATRFLTMRLGWDATESLGRAAFIGDSENDEACFAAFRTTIAVRNFRGRPTVPPRFVTEAPRGDGFAEAASVILSRRHATVL